VTQQFQNVLTNPIALIVWILLVLGSVAILVRDFRASNPDVRPMMKWVWVFTVLYSGPIGLAIYYYSGRKQIPRDSLWRRACRSVAHCYSGCGAGEITGVFIAAGLLSLGNLGITVITFVLAYAAGFTLTVGPLTRQGVPFKEALWDAVYSETASITVMEIVAVGVDLWLSQSAKMGDVLFWSSLVFSLTMGLIAAYPVNVLLVHFGVKEGMADPTERRRHVAHAGTR
jgi:hypothetical protein